MGLTAERRTVQTYTQHNEESTTTTGTEILIYSFHPALLLLQSNRLTNKHTHPHNTYLCCDLEVFVLF